jgi:hypothetical protein
MCENGPRKGTGPRYVLVDGMTAKVKLIISRTDAIEPRVLWPRLLLPP